MDYLTTIRLAEALQGKSVYDVLAQLNIPVVIKSYFLDGKHDAAIISDNGEAMIFIKPDLGLPYSEFLLEHELGHFLDMGFSTKEYRYNKSEKKADEERTANTFAVIRLLSRDNPDEKDIFTASREKGIPIEIAKDVIFSMRSLSNNRVAKHYFDQYL